MEHDLGQHHRGSVVDGGAGKANVEAFLWFAFVHAAVYNAVIGITGEYGLYEWNARAPQGGFSGGSRGRHAAAWGIDGVLGGIRHRRRGNPECFLRGVAGADPRRAAKDQGIRYGKRAADRLIEAPRRWAVCSDCLQPPPNLAARASGGPRRGDSVHSSTRGWGWSTPSFSILSLSSTPVHHPDRRQPLCQGVRGGPRLRGELRFTPYARTDRDRPVLLDIRIVPMQAGLRDLVTRRALDIWEQRTALRGGRAQHWPIPQALSGTAKFRYGWWRPITAIRAADRTAIRTPPGFRAGSRCSSHAALSGLAERICAASSPLLTSGVLDPTDRRRHGRPEPHATAAAGSHGTTTSAALFRRMQIDARYSRAFLSHQLMSLRSVDRGKVANWALDHYFAPAN